MLTIETLLAVVQADPELPPTGQIPSAVLMALVTMETGDTGIILTERSAGLRNHAGQISFPGGRIDADETPVDTALREAERKSPLTGTRSRCLATCPAWLQQQGFISHRCLL